MIDKLAEVVLAGIILVVGLGIFLITRGADPDVIVSLISGVTEFGVFILVIGILVAIPLSILSQASG
jgi:uncharacterized membrane protein (DUF106 family)